MPWVIVLPQDDGSRIYWCASGGSDRWAGTWTRDIGHAIQYHRRQDVDRTLRDPGWPAGTTVQEVTDIER